MGRAFARRPLAVKRAARLPRMSPRACRTGRGDAKLARTARRPPRFAVHIRGDNTDGPSRRRRHCSNSRPPERCASPSRWRPRPRRNSRSKTATIYRGVAVTLGTALAKKLGVPVEIVAHKASGEIQNSAADNKWDVAFLPVDDERKKFVDFGNAYHLLQSTFLVAPGSKIASVKDADAEGVGIGGVANTATFRAAEKATPKATHIDFAGVDAAVAAMNDEQDRGDRAVARVAFRPGRQDPRLAHPRRRLPQFLHRGLRAQGQAGGAGLCQRLHRGGESLRPGAPGARRDGAEFVASSPRPG